MDDSLTLGEYHLPESISIENKAIYLQETDELSDYNIYILLSNGVLTSELSLIIKNNLLKFLENVVPKYVSCFSNSKIDGRIYFGIDDSCEITGIPYIDTIPQEEIYTIIQKTILENVKFNREQVGINSLYQVKIINLNTSIDLLSNDSQKYYDIYSKKAICNMTTEEIFRQKRLEWLTNLAKYTQKLERVLNILPIRKELREYMVENGSTQDISGLIDILDSGVFIPLDPEVIFHERNDPKSIFHWATRFRDYKTEEVIKLKPSRPDTISLFYPRQILSNLSLSRYNFVKNGAKYYIIEVSIRGSIVDDDVEYRHPSYPEKWNYRKRVDTDYAGPSCI